MSEEKLKKMVDSNPVVKQIKKICTMKRKLMKMFVAGDEPEKIIKKQLTLIRGQKNVLYFKNKTPGAIDEKKYKE